MAETLIGADQTVFLLAIIAVVTFTLFLVDDRFNHPVFSGSVLLFVIPPLLSNLSIIPFTAPAYDMLWEYGLPLALPMVLLSANLKKIFTETGPVLIAFAVATVVAMVGARLGALVLSVIVYGDAIAGTLTASYVGGTMNFAATSKALELDDPTMLAATLAADSMYAPVLISLVSGLAGFGLIKRFFRPEGEEGVGPVADRANDHQPSETMPRVSVLDLAGLLALAFGIFTVSKVAEQYIDLPAISVLVITVLSIAAGQVLPRFAERCAISFDIGMVILYFVFVGAFAGVNVSVALSSGLILIVYVGILIAVQMLICLSLSAMFKLRYSEAAIGLMAAATGPTVAAAFATSKKWRDLVTPAILAGLLGYVIGNFSGLFVGGLLRGVGG